MKKLKIECTPAAKGDTILEYQKVVEMEFLKRNTIKHDGYYFGALQINSFQKMLNWSEWRIHHYYKDIGKYGYHRDSIINTMDAALRESVLHGREFFEKTYTHLQKVNMKEQWGVILPSYDDLRTEMQLPFL